MNYRDHAINTILNKAWGLLLIIVLVIAALPGTSASADASTPDEPSNLGNTIYLPLTIQGGPPPVLLLGVYPKSYWQPMVDDALAIEFESIEKWSGKKLSLAGVYHSIDQYNSVGMLSAIWDQGYTPFVNIYFKYSAYQIASGKADSEIRAWAKGYVEFSQGGQRVAFLAPMQEMNGYWVPYGEDPTNFKIAFQRMIQIFEQEGVKRSHVQWVFAPNGWSEPGHPQLEDYYPGDDYVDTLAFSAYNFGYHPLNPYKQWETPEQVFPEYINRMKALAPSKPVIIAQTGTTAYYNSSRTQNAEMKNAWLRDAYQLFLEFDNVIGVIYYNANPDYDWSFFRPDGSKFTGYLDGIASPSYEYVSPTELMELNFLQ